MWPLSGSGTSHKLRPNGSMRRRQGLRKENTLTQMDFVRLPPEYDDIESSKDSSQKPRKRRKKSAVTLPASTPTYHTQTITQLDWSFNSAPEEEVWNEDMLGVPSLRGSEAMKNAHGDLSEERRLLDTRAGSLAAVKSVLRTPVKRTSAFEIPSSQSPETPLSVRSQASAHRRSPLTDRSSNTSIAFKSTWRTAMSQSKPTKLEVKDTFESTENGEEDEMNSSQLKQVSPPKSVRFAVNESEASTTPSKGRQTLLNRKPSPRQVWECPSGHKGGFSKSEISDSDADSEDDSERDNSEQPEMIGESASIDGLLGGFSDVDALLEIPVVENCPQAKLEAKLKVGNQSENASSKESNNLDHQNAEPSVYGRIPETLSHSIIESQRLNTQYVDKMPPRTPDSDIFVSMFSKAVHDIRERTKDYDFRAYEFPKSVSRIWIYELKPASTLRYMATIGPTRVPGEIADDTGKGNKEFNAKAAGRNFAYKILELYELADPLHIQHIRKRDWFTSAPHKWIYVRPAVLDELMANLKPPIFSKDPPLSASPRHSSTDSQEVEGQIISNIRQYTQFESQRSNDTYRSPTLPCPSRSDIQLPQGALLERDNENINTSSNVSPSQATTVDLTQTSPSYFPGMVKESPGRPVMTPLKGSSDEELGIKSTFETIPPVFLPSSQMLTKSQMLPHSLLDESLRGPPGWVDDLVEDEDAGWG